MRCVLSLRGPGPSRGAPKGSNGSASATGPPALPLCRCSGLGAAHVAPRVPAVTSSREPFWSLVQEVLSLEKSKPGRNEWINQKALHWKGL